MIDAQKLADEIADIHAALAVHDAAIVALARTLGPHHHALLLAALAEDLEALKAHALQTRASERMLRSIDEQSDRLEAMIRSLRAPTDRTAP